MHFDPRMQNGSTVGTMSSKLLFDTVIARAESSGPLFVIGPSGAGTSSLLWAGLIPAA
jgi:hypothetical protein